MLCPVNSFFLVHPIICVTIECFLWDTFQTLTISLLAKLYNFPTTIPGNTPHLQDLSGQRPVWITSTSCAQILFSVLQFRHIPSLNLHQASPISKFRQARDQFGLPALPLPDRLVIYLSCITQKLKAQLKFSAMLKEWPVSWK